MRPVYAVYPSRQHLPPKVRLLVEALTALVDPMLPIERPPWPGAKKTRRSRA